MLDVFSTLPIAEKEKGSKLYLFVRDKFYAASIKVLGQKVTDTIERLAGQPGSANRKAAWEKYFSAVTENRAQTEAFYHRFRRAHRGTYEENGIPVAYQIDAAGEIVAVE